MVFFNYGGSSLNALEWSYCTSVPEDMLTDRMGRKFARPHLRTHGPLCVFTRNGAITSFEITES